MIFKVRELGDDIEKALGEMGDVAAVVGRMRRKAGGIGVEKRLAESKTREQDQRERLEKIRQRF